MKRFLPFLLPVERFRQSLECPRRLQHSRSVILPVLQETHILTQPQELLLRVLVHDGKGVDCHLEGGLSLLVPLVVRPTFLEGLCEHSLL